MASLWRKHQQRLRQAAAPNRYSTRYSCSCAAFAIVLLAAIALLLLYLDTIQNTTQILHLGSHDPATRDLDPVKNAAVDTDTDREKNSGVCDYSRGRWVFDPQRKAPYNESCVDIFKGWNCLKNKRSNAHSYLQWRWRPDGCDLAQLNPTFFLENLRGKRIGFVGDSLNRNMYVSLVCALKQAVGKDFKKWRPIGSDKAITFLGYNVTVAYHRTNLLVRYGEWKFSTQGGPLEDLGYKQGYRIDVDIPHNTWFQAPPYYDVLIINTGHWWFAPEKFPVTSPMLFFENGKPVLPPKAPAEGLDLALKYMLRFVEQNKRPGGMMFLRTQSPRHFDGGDWNEGGKCRRLHPLQSSEVEDMFSLATSKGVNREVRLVNEHLIQGASRSASFRILNITHLSEFRADAHPSTSAKKKHEDCMHWCLPGVIDTWNDILWALISASTTGVL